MRKDFLEAGKVVGTHGVKGDVRFQPWSDDSSFLNNIKTVYLTDKTPLSIVSAKPHGNIIIVSFKDVNSIEEAEKLRNKIVLVKRDDLKIPEGRYFIDEIISSNVYNKNDELLGVLTDVSKTGANDVWHITRNDKEYLVPAIESVVISVDIDSERIVIDPMEGIFDEN